LQNFESQLGARGQLFASDGSLDLVVLGVNQAFVFFRTGRVCPTKLTINPGNLSCISDLLEFEQRAFQAF
jgi:hypothetical protein